MTDLILTIAALLAVAEAWAAWHYWKKQRASQCRADRLHAHCQRLTQQLRSAEIYVGQLSDTVIPTVDTAVKNGRGPQLDLAAPDQLRNTPLADRLHELGERLGASIVQVGQQAQIASAQQITHVRLETERQVAQARHESVDVARASVRSFAKTVVQRAAKLSSLISAGVRRHVSDEAYATLVEIDHLAQQMLLTASGYAVLAGDKLSRRWPATTLTEIVRSAMGRIEGYERVQHPSMDLVAVEGRAVEAVVHTLAVLLDNALRYSPPAAGVYVTLQQGHSASFLIVDDAGLRMEDERLVWARDVMSGKRRDDIRQLGAYPQTGLRVASRLAESYGFRVEVTAPNLYQGTRAVIVLPPALLAAPVPSQPVTVPVDAPGTALPEPGSASTTASGLTVRQRATRPAPAVRALSGDVVEPGRPEVAAAWVAGSRRGREGQSTPVSTKDMDHG